MLSVIMLSVIMLSVVLLNVVLLNVVMLSVIMLSHGGPFWGRLLILTTTIRLGCKSLPGTNTLPYHEHSQITDIKFLWRRVQGPVS